LKLRHTDFEQRHIRQHAIDIGWRATAYGRPSTPHGRPFIETDGSALLRPGNPDNGGLPL